MALPFEDIVETEVSEDGDVLVCGEIFFQEEIRQYVDFSDIVKSYGYKDDTLSDFMTERFKKVGYRFYLAMHLPVGDLGAMALGEDDKRIIKIIHQRCVQNQREEDGRKFIILPGEI